MTATSAGQLTPGRAEAGDPRRLLTVLLRRFGIPVAETVSADSADSAVEAAWWLGFPVTLVAEGSGLAERTEITRCGLATPAQVRMAYRQLAASIGPAMTGVRLRRQPQYGAEVVVRITRGTAVPGGVPRGPGAPAGEGPALVSLALGGPAAALVGAQVTRQAPVTARDARDMLAELRGAPGLGHAAVTTLAGAAVAGFHPLRARPGGSGQPGHTRAPAGAGQQGAAYGDAEPPQAPPQAHVLDLAAVADLLERVSRLAMCVPQLAELELNPVAVTSCGVAVASVHGRFSRNRGVRAKVTGLRNVS